MWLVEVNTQEHQSLIHVGMFTSQEGQKRKYKTLNTVTWDDSTQDSGLIQHFSNMRVVSCPFLSETFKPPLLPPRRMRLRPTHQELRTATMYNKSRAVAYRANLPWEITVTLKHLPESNSLHIPKIKKKKMQKVITYYAGCTKTQLPIWKTSKWLTNLVNNVSNLELKK